MNKKPTLIQLSAHKSKDLLSLGPAKFYINPELIKSIRCPEDNPLIFIKCNNCKITVMPPCNITYYSKYSEKLWPELTPKLAELKKDLIEDFFAVEAKAARVTAKSYAEIIMMGSDEFHLYITLASVKTVIDLNQNGIGIIETPHIKGIVRFGVPETPGKIIADVYSPDSKFGQTILVASANPEKSKKILFEILSSYRFTIEDVPEEDALRKMIIKKLERHNKFQKK